METGEREVVGKARRGEAKLATVDKELAVVAAAAPDGPGMHQGPNSERNDHRFDA